MTSVMNKTVEAYNYLITDLADPRTSHFFLLASPWPILALTGLYLYFCTSLGPRYMRDREPYKLQKAVLLYNLCQVLMSTYLAYEGSVHILSGRFNFKCEIIDYSDDPTALRLASAIWWYFFSKVTEFMDTIFFVLRKKNSQISFLHVYHHSLMAVMTWIAAKYLPGGNGILMGTLNACVHIVMYTYYLIAGLGPQYQKYIWWKKHVTILQMVQFVLVLIHSLNNLFRDCSYPKTADMLICFNALLFINLFGRFFYASYVKVTDRNESVKKMTNGKAKSESEADGNAKSESEANGKAKSESAVNGIRANGSTNKHSFHGHYGLSKNGESLNGKHKDI